MSLIKLIRILDLPRLLDAVSKEDPKGPRLAVIVSLNHFPEIGWYFF